MLGLLFVFISGLSFYLMSDNQTLVLNRLSADFLLLCAMICLFIAGAMLSQQYSAVVSFLVVLSGLCLTLMVLPLAAAMLRIRYDGGHKAQAAETTQPALALLSKQSYR
jgi:hypothetical protein